MSKFRLDDMINVTFANTEYMKNKKILDMYDKLNTSMVEANSADDLFKSEKQQQYMKAFMSVMDKMNEELSAAKSKYQNLDKQKLKAEKCQEIAAEIQFFREQCYIYRKKLEEEKVKLMKDRIEEDILKQEKQALLKNLKKQGVITKRQKQERKQHKKFMQTHQTQIEDPLNFKKALNMLQEQYPIKEVRTFEIRNRNQKEKSILAPATERYMGMDKRKERQGRRLDRSLDHQNSLLKRNIGMWRQNRPVSALQKNAKYEKQGHLRGSTKVSTLREPIAN